MTTDDIDKEVHEYQLPTPQTKRHGQGIEIKCLLKRQLTI